MKKVCEEKWIKTKTERSNNSKERKYIGQQLTEEKVKKERWKFDKKKGNKEEIKQESNYSKEN